MIFKQRNKNHFLIDTHFVRILLENIIQKRNRFELQTRDCVIIVTHRSHLFYCRIEGRTFPKIPRGWIANYCAYEG